MGEQGKSITSQPDAAGMVPFLFDVVEGGLDPPDAHAPR